MLLPNYIMSILDHCMNYFIVEAIYILKIILDTQILIKNIFLKLGVGMGWNASYLTQEVGVNWDFKT